MPPARQIGRYALHDEIASGGMASVHIGRLLGEAGFSRVVAIKRMHENYAKDPELVAMFLDEARLAARIRHPNVVPTLDVVALDQELFLVMELVQGESLAYFLRRVRAEGHGLPPALSCHLMAGVLHGLHAAHEATDELGNPLHLVHRDVSPHNVLVGVDGVPRVVDFGVAKALGRAHQTRDGQLKGKMQYMAPELLEGKQATRAVDIYAAAIVLWELLTGTRLYEADTDAQLLYKVLDAHVSPPSGLSPGLPPRLDALVMKGLARDPSARFSTASEMACELEAIYGPLPSSSVAQWVRDTARESLARRADLIARVEREPSQPSFPSLALLEGRASASGASEPVRVPAAVASGTTNPTNPTATRVSPAGRSPSPSPLLLAAATAAAVASLAIGGVLLLRPPASSKVAASPEPQAEAVASHRPAEPEPVAVAPVAAPALASAAPSLPPPEASATAQVLPAASTPAAWPHAAHPAPTVVKGVAARPLGAAPAKAAAAKPDDLYRRDN